LSKVTINGIYRPKIANFLVVTGKKHYKGQMTEQDNLFDLIDGAPSPSENPDDKKAAKTAEKTAAPKAGVTEDPPPPAGANAPMEYSVSEISQQLKKMVEGQFSYVRVRGELSRVTIAKSGHMYSSLKDEKAVLDAICWRGVLGRLSIRPEEGLDVIVTGRLTTYPGRSNYQIIIESMELAGEGALLKMLEERRKKLAAEGLFDPAHKKQIPYLPKRIGVITSPTGAVIRDIMHRLNERFPRPVLLWPAVVQGEQAAQQVSEGIQAFNNLPIDSPHRPDLLIVARGGGSLEDLMPFNDERVVRAIAASDIPIICAVGHETDTSLADYAADLRAPTPTGAAEKAVPVRADLISTLKQTDLRLHRSVHRWMTEQQNRLQGLARGLTHPRRMLENVIQRLDSLSNRLDNGLAGKLHLSRRQLIEAASKLSLSNQRHKLSHQAERMALLGRQLNRSLLHSVTQSRQKLVHTSGRLTLTPYGQQLRHQKTVLATQTERLNRAINHKIETDKNRLTSQSALLESLSFKKVLERGYTVVWDENDKPVTASKQLESGQKLNIEFKDGKAKVISQ